VESSSPKVLFFVFKNLPKENNRPMSEKSPNLVTLAVRLIVIVKSN
jgi:hypothetical protein